MHDSIGCQRGLVTAVSALILTACLDGVTMPTTADTSYKPGGPLYFVQVFYAGVLVRESLNKPG